MSSVMAYVSALLVIDTFHLDWRWVFRLPVLLLATAGIIFFFVARDQLSDTGFSRAEEPEEDAAHATPEGETSLLRYRGVLRNIRIHIGGCALGFQNAARYGLIVWVPAHFLGANWKAAGGGLLNPVWITVAPPGGRTRSGR